MGVSAEVLLGRLDRAANKISQMCACSFGKLAKQHAENNGMNGALLTKKTGLRHLWGQRAHGNPAKKMLGLAVVYPLANLPMREGIFGSKSAGRRGQRTLRAGEKGRKAPLDDSDGAKSLFFDGTGIENSGGFVVFYKSEQE